MGFEDHDFREVPVPSNEELIEARERADRGLRLAFPELTERLSVAQPQPDLDPEEAAKRAGSDLLDIRDQVGAQLAERHAS